jgi:hypothetical protein
MSRDIPRRTRILLSVQRALLGEVSANLRAVTAHDDELVLVVFYFDGPISEEDAETVSVIHTEIIADFFPEVEVEVKCVRLDAPTRIEDDGLRIYRRKELSCRD